MIEIAPLLSDAPLGVVALLLAYGLAHELLRVVQAIWGDEED